MERSGNTIVNTKAEQELYHVAPVVSVASAIETADVFSKTADILADKAEHAIDSASRESRNQFVNNLTRSAQLRRYASGIIELCAPEIVEKMLNPEDED